MCGIDLVEVRVVARTAVQRRHVLASRSLPQPYAFALRQVTHQAQVTARLAVLVLGAPGVNED